MTDRAALFVSVIIPVYNDSARLEACLAALERQTYGAEQFEVIVVDNGSTEPVAPVVSTFRHARLEREEQPGPYAARNIGIGTAIGDVLAFTDSDCVPAPTWIANGVARLVSVSGCGLVGGAIEVVFEDVERPRAAELWTVATCFMQEANLGDHFAATGNLFTFRAVVDRVGHFDATLRSGGDVEWGQRVFAAGYRQSFADDARVTHPAFRSLGDVARRMARFAARRQRFERQFGDPNLALSRCVPTAFSHYREFFRRLNRDPRLCRPLDKLKVVGVAIAARAVFVWEISRLRLGASAVSPARRRSSARTAETSEKHKAHQ